MLDTVREYRASFAILLFLAAFSLIMFVIKPSLVYNEDGSLKQFGAGRHRKSVVNVMVLTIVLSTLSYLAVNMLI